VATNWRAGRYGEIDIIAYYPPTYLLAFIEVKTRYSSTFGSPLEAVTVEKQRKIRNAAEHYLVACPPTFEVRNIRFDVIAVDGQGIVTHYPNAF
jgi:putative endonuclease